MREVDKPSVGILALYWLGRLYEEATVAIGRYFDPIVTMCCWLWRIPERTLSKSSAPAFIIEVVVLYICSVAITGLSLYTRWWVDDDWFEPVILTGCVSIMAVFVGIRLMSVVEVSLLGLWKDHSHRASALRVLVLLAVAVSSLVAVYAVLDR